MPIIHLDGIGDPRLAVYAGMSDARLREFPEAPHGLFMAESRKVIDRALDAGVRPWSLLVEDRRFDAARSAIERMLAVWPETPAFVATEGQFRAVTGYAITRGALAAFERPAPLSVEDALAGACRVAVLEDVINYRNVGAAFRAAAALGIDAVLVTPSCHDPLYRRAARESKGAVLQVPWTRIGDTRDWAREGVPLLHRLGFKVAALALSDDSVPLGDARLAAEGRLALVLGTEGDGLAPATVAACDWTVRIPMAHGVDSLNVAAASAVAFWELQVRR